MGSTGLQGAPHGVAGTGSNSGRLGSMSSPEETPRSRRLTQPLLEGADLVLGMSRRHVQEAVLLDPGEP